MIYKKDDVSLERNVAMDLYEINEIERYRKKKTIARNVAILLGILILSACIYICTLVTPYNSAELEKIVIGLFVVGGWVEIYLLVEVFLMAKREESHTRLILEGEKESFTGRVEVRKETFHIPQSITIRKVFLHDDSGKEEVVRRLNVDIRREKEILGLNGKRAVVTVSHGYIIAGEEMQ